MNTEQTHVLVMGYRAGLARSLQRRGIPFAVWTNKDVHARKAERVYLHDFPRTRSAVGSALEPLLDLPPFTHVIAGTETAVMTAALARRSLGARAATFTTALRCHDKLAMKQYLHKHGIPMTRFLDGNAPLTTEEVFERLGTPVVAKDRKSTGGRGIVFAQTNEELERVPRRGILERFVDAPEVSVESFIHNSEIVFENITQYREKAAVNVVPAELPDDVREAVLALNRKTLRTQRITWGLTHLETYLTDRGPLFGEVALRPPGGYIMDLLQLAWDMDAWDAFVAVELDQPFEFPREPSAHASAWIVHPGAGTVTEVAGVDEARRHPAVHELRLKVQVGDVVPERTGVGQDVGRVLFRAPSRRDLIAGIDEVQRTLRIRVRPPAG